MSLIAPDRPAPASLRGQRHARELAEGRTCYQHLAGHLGVALHDHFLAEGLITASYELTPAGRSWLADRGVDIQGRGTGLRPCVDWTERRPHLAGALANLLTGHALTHGWIKRGSHPRSVRITPEGRHQMLPE